jgi:hypothetical protein
MSFKVISNKHNFEAAYKKGKSGKLIWVSCFAQSEKAANEIMDNYVFKKHGCFYRRYAGSLPIKQTDSITH